jgi:hypothetical protein
MTQKDKLLQTLVWDVSSGEQTLRDVTKEELKDMEESLFKIKLEKENLEKKSAFRNSALNKLLALGLTIDEIEAL